MIRNYFKIAFRNLRSHKLYSFINIGGLSLGLTACILIMFYVSHEHSYDQFHTDADKIYTLRAKTLFGSDTIYMQKFSVRTAELIADKSPSVESAQRIYSEYKPVVIKSTGEDTKAFSEEGLFYADADFFNFFSFNLKQGNKNTALKDPFSIVISEDIAHKYFGDENPIGQNLEIKKDSTYQFKVTGVVKDSPSNSSIDTRLITSISSLQKMKENTRDFTSQILQPGSFTTYLKIKDPKDVTKVLATTNQLSKEGYSEAKEEFLLYPFTDTHHKYSHSSIVKYLDSFPLIADLILFLALINYMSLTTARAASRSKEIGIRKVNGASRKNIALQFYVESAIFISLSFIIAGALSYFLKDPFFRMLDIKIDSSFFFNPDFTLILGGIFILSILLAGLYPAIVMSSFKPIDNFRQKLQHGFGGNMVRKVCTTLQFVIAVVLIIGGIIIQRQMSHLRNIDTGLNRSDIVMLPIQRSMGNNIGAFRSEIEKLPAVKNTALSNFPIYKGYNMYFASSENTESTGLPTMSVDDHFFEVLDAQWKFPPASQQLISQPKKLVINESAIEKFHLNPDPRGQVIKMANSPFEVVGVVKDFNFETLSSPITALGMMVSKKDAAANEYSSGCLYIKYAQKAGLTSFINDLKSIYGSYDTESDFNYQFMDDAFNAMFKSEEKLAHIFNIFIILTILIAGMGLLGLATFSAQQRIKEIGIRKVLGASVFQITSSLSIEFLKLVLLAIIIASPIAWYFGQNWLDNFAYRINIDAWTFIFASIFTVGIAVLTISIQTLKAAKSNPVKSLRSE